MISSQLASNENQFSVLSPREKEVLLLLTDAQSNKLIAYNLNISQGTANLHVRSILRKLKVSSRTKAALVAVKQGFDIDQTTMR